MGSDIKNVTESDTRKDFATFTVDAKGVTPAMVHELAERVQDMMQGAAMAHLFDQDTHPHAAISAVRDPLKFEVRCPAPLQNCLLYRCKTAASSYSGFVAHRQRRGLQ